MKTKEEHDKAYIARLEKLHEERVAFFAKLVRNGPYAIPLVENEYYGYRVYLEIRDQLKDNPEADIIVEDVIWASYNSYNEMPSPSTKGLAARAEYAKRVEDIEGICKREKCKRGLPRYPDMNEFRQKVYRTVDNLSPGRRALLKIRLTEMGQGCYSRINEVEAG